jgi:hypothetical protein
MGAARRVEHDEMTRDSKLTELALATVNVEATAAAKPREDTVLCPWSQHKPLHHRSMTGTRINDFPFDVGTFHMAYVDRVPLMRLRMWITDVRVAFQDKRIGGWFHASYHRRSSSSRSSRINKKPWKNERCSIRHCLVACFSGKQAS